MTGRTDFFNTNTGQKAMKSGNLDAQFLSHAETDYRKDQGNPAEPTPLKSLAGSLLTNPLNIKDGSHPMRNQIYLIDRSKTFFHQLKLDVSSKINDGLIPPVVLILLTLLFNLIVIPIANVLKLPGLLVFILLLLSLGSIELDRSIQGRYSHTEQAFHGMLAGIFFWFSVDSVGYITAADNFSQAAVIFMLLVSLVVIALWRTVFPSGVKFFAMVFLLNWVGRYLFSGDFSLGQNVGWLFNSQLILGSLVLF